MMHDVYREHSAMKCGNLNVSLISELKLGFGSKFQFTKVHNMWISFFQNGQLHKML